MRLCNTVVNYLISKEDIGEFNESIQFSYHSKVKQSISLPKDATVLFDCESELFTCDMCTR